jgi:hypothetical protein
MAPSRETWKHGKTLEMKDNQNDWGNLWKQFPEISGKLWMVCVYCLFQQKNENIVYSPRPLDL